MAQYSLRRGVGVILLHNPPVNGLSLAVRDGILRSLDAASKDKAQAVVLMGSGRTFPAGADISEFARGTYAAHPDLNTVLRHMDDFDRPLIACIHGTALGGGLETALACHWRIGAKSCMVGLPEVHLGILPGAGGTQRLPRITGFSNAVEIIASGRMLKAREALDLGILDQIFETKAKSPSSEELIDAALAFAESEIVTKTSYLSRKLSAKSVPKGLSAEEFDRVMGNVKKSSRGFVAPEAIVKAVQAAAVSPTFEFGMEKERALFQGLMSGTQAKALQYFFFAERRVGKIPDIPDDVAVKPIASVGIIGGGTMGAGIAMNFIEAGYPITLVETSPELSAAAVSRIEKTYKLSSAFKKGTLTEEKLSQYLSKIIPATEFASLKNSDIIIEAAYENMELKKKIFIELSKVCKPEALLATNTSYLSIDEIASVTGSRRENVIGTHFFSPANVMKLLEVVRGDSTSHSAIATCMDLGKKIGKISVLSGNCHGFIGNRMLKSYGQEAIYLVEEGATPSQVDAALKKKIGLAMGMFEMMDLAGNDIGWRQRLEMGVTEKANRDPSKRYSSLSDKLCDRGFFGQKTGNGWYHYDSSAPRTPLVNHDTLSMIHQHRLEEGFTARSFTDDEIVERCLYPLVNEGFKILEEGIAIRPDDIDVVYVYGYGFPRYRGGPMWWAEQEIGLAKVLTAIKKYQKEFPLETWWKPSALLESAVASGAPLREELHFLRKDQGAKKKQ